MNYTDLGLPIALTPPVAFSVSIPQGRLTLVSGMPVPTSDQTAKTTIYYDQYAGNLVPNYNGSADVNLTITGGEVSLVLDATNHLSGKIYDIFAIPNSGAVRLVTGPAWTNTTTRSAALSMAARGYITNNASITHAYNNSTDYGPLSANQATYLGSFYATANGQTGVMLKPAAAAGGSANIIGLFNAYNRVRATSFERDGTENWTYSTDAWRVADGNTNNSISFIDGLGVINTNAIFHNMITTSDALTTGGAIGINLNSSTATPDVRMDALSGQPSSAFSCPTMVTNSWYPVLGYNTVYAMEKVGFNGTPTGTCTFNITGGEDDFLGMALTLFTEY